jgi:Xaa-Pro aminopeptidase
LGRWDKYFIHGLGHGVGARIHEFPRIRKKSRNYLKEGMAVTSEPGIYVKGKFGMRIEDTCLVKRDSCVILTKSTKRLLVFNAPN